jgi:hypothetical protein
MERGKILAIRGSKAVVVIITDLVLFSEQEVRGSSPDTVKCCSLG